MVTGGIYMCMNLAKAVRDRWVQAQFALLLVLDASGPLLPRYGSLGPAGSGAQSHRPLAVRVAGIVGLPARLRLCGVGRANARRGPHPRARAAAGASLVESGPYGLVRHPIYTGIVVASAGWTLAWSNWTLALVVGVVLACFFEAKARVEERWLRARFPAYDGVRATGAAPRRSG